jgi:tetratricopeptide (TPR) repeat protein
MLLKHKNILIKTSLTFLLLIFVGCCNDEDGKLPITTSSCDARENYLIGRELADNLQKQEALVYFEKAIEQDPDFALAYFGAGLAQSKEEDIFKFLEKSIELIEEVSEGEKLIIKGIQAGINNDFEKQLEYSQKLEEKYPTDEYVLYQIGNLYFSQHKFEKAIEYYKKIIQINTEFAPVYNQLGYALRNLEKFDAAEKVFKKYIKLIPNNPNPYDSYGELLLKMGEYEASLEQYRKAIKHDSNFVASYIGMASNLVYISDYYEARLLMERFYNKARNDAEKRRALIFTAISYVDEGKYKDAIEVLEKLAKKSKENNDDVALATSNGIISAIYFDLEKYDKAISYYKIAIEAIENSNLPNEIKNNSRFDILFGEALVLAKKTKFEAALKKADEYMAKAEKSGNSNQIRNGHEIYGRIALDKKEYNKAIEEFNQANLHNPYILFMIAQAYEELNDIENAKIYLKKIIKFNSLLELDYAFCRNKAKDKLIDLQ